VRACDVFNLDCRGAPGKLQLLPPEILRELLRQTGGPLVGAYSAKSLDIFQLGVVICTLTLRDYPYKLGDKLDRDSLRSVVGPEGCPFPEVQQNSDRCMLVGLLNRKGALGWVEPMWVDLLEQMMAPNPQLRLGASPALRHGWLAEDARQPAAAVGVQSSQHHAHACSPVGNVSEQVSRSPG